MIKRIKFGRTLWVGACTIVLSSIIGLTGCSQNNLSNVEPFIPPGYYASTPVLPFDLSVAYWSPYISRKDADLRFVGKPYVFKNFQVTSQMLSTANDGYLWVDLVKAYPLNPANLKQLSVGEKVDMVGVFSGGCRDFPNSLTFSNVVFLPSGDIQIPIGDSSQFQSTPTY